MNQQYEPITLHSVIALHTIDEWLILHNRGVPHKKWTIKNAR